MDGKTRHPRKRGSPKMNVVSLFFLSTSSDRRKVMCGGGWNCPAEKAINRKYLQWPPVHHRRARKKRVGGWVRSPMRRRVIKYWSGRWLRRATLPTLSTCCPFLHARRRRNSIELTFISWIPGVLCFTGWLVRAVILVNRKRRTNIAKWNAVRLSFDNETFRNTPSRLAKRY